MDSGAQILQQSIHRRSGGQVQPLFDAQRIGLRQKIGVYAGQRQTAGGSALGIAGINSHLPAIVP